MTTEKYTDVYYELINQSKPPFDNITARKALAMSLDADAYNEVRNLGLFTMAFGPFAPGWSATSRIPGCPYDLTEAKMR